MANPLFTSGQAAQTMPSQAMQIIAPDLALQQTQLSRQQQLANMLRQQSLEPMGDTQTIGGWAIKKSPLEGLSKLAQALGANYMQNKNDEQQLDLSKAFNQKLGITPQPPTDQASTDALNQGAAVGDIGPTNSNAQRMGEILSRPSPQQNNRLPYDQLIGSLVAGEIGGAPAQTAFWKQHELTDATKLAMAAGVDPHEANVQALKKANYIPMTRLSEGTYADPALGVIGLPAQAPPGSINVKGPNGWTNQPVIGGLEAVSAAAGAKEGAEQSNQIKMVKQTDGSEIPMWMGNVAGAPPISQNQPSNQPPGNPNIPATMDFKGMTPKQVLAQGMRIKDPAEREQFLNQLKQSQQPTQNQQAPTPQGIGQSTFAKKTAEMDASNMAGYSKALDDRVQTGSDLNMRLQEQFKALQEFKAGGGTETRAKMASMVQAMGLPDTIVNKIAGGDLAAEQVFKKNAAQTAMEQLKQAMGGSGRITQAEFKVFQDNNPNLSTDPNAIKKIFDFGTKVYNRDLQEQQAYQDYKQKNLNNTAGFGAYWSKQNQERGFTNPNMNAQSGKTFDSLPNPAQFNGKRMKAPDGTIIKSNGKMWVKE